METLTLYCEYGKHNWQYIKKWRGRTPKNCPEHTKIVKRKYASEWEKKYRKRPYVKNRHRKYMNNEYKIKTSNYIQKKKLMVIEHYGGKCVCCGTTYLPHLNIDHIHNDGKKEREKHNNNIYVRIVKEEFPKNRFQIMCYNCNQTKDKYGECLCQTGIIPILKAVKEKMRYCA